jgi:two-component system sensor histidine kinase UhpB
MLDVVRDDSQRQLGNVLRKLPVAFFTLTCDLPPRCVWASASVEVISGFPSSCFVDDAMFWLSRVHPDERVYCATALDARISSVGSSQTEFRWQCADDTYKWFRCRRTTVANDRGQPEEILAAWFPIDDIKDAADEAKRAEIARDVGLRLEAAREKDQQRIARDLHDQLGSRLTGVLLELEALESTLAGSSRDVVSRIREEVRAAGSDLGRVIRGLHPVALDVGTLSSALGELAREHERLHRVPTRVVVRGVEEARISKRTAICLYRIVQEALTNAGKHASARSVSVAVSGYADRCVRAVVEDDGCGFSVDAEQSSEHVGLHSMRKRASLLGGTLSIESARGRGTAVHVVVPIEAPPISKVDA